MNTENKTEFSYDTCPYHSYPFQYTHPIYLNAIGTFFGMNPPKVKTARILELGCASGGNIIPMALEYPKAEVVGVDLSQVQINEAKFHAKNLNLKNIEFHQMSISDIDESFGKFDYIITHGVFSWVPKDVQEKILQISKNNLSPNGIAYISYNTLPGWNMTKTVRDLMLYHASAFSTIKDKVTQAKLILDFIKEVAENSSNTYSGMIEEELKKILAPGVTDDYIHHEYLGEINEAMYFYEFIDKIKSYKLQYLADTTLTSMSLDNFPQVAREKLSSIKGQEVMEQYLDFIINRQFRCSLACHDNISLKRAVSYKTLEKLYVTARITPEKPLSECDLNSGNISVTFHINVPQKFSITCTSLETAAIFYALSNNPCRPLSMDEIIDQAAEIIKTTNKDLIKNELSANLVKIILSGYLKIYSESTRSINQVTAKPKAYELAYYQAKNLNQNWVTNNFHEKLVLDVFPRLILQFLDGKHTHEEIVLELLKLHKEGKFNILQDNIPVTDENKVIDSIRKGVASNLLALAQNGLLVG